MTLAELGDTSIPTTAPLVLGTLAVEPVVLEGGGAVMGGRVVEVCGVDGRDDPYRAET